MQLQAKFQTLHVDPVNRLIHTAVYLVTNEDGSVSGELMLVGKGENLDTNENASLMILGSTPNTELEVVIEDAAPITNKAKDLTVKVSGDVVA